MCSIHSRALWTQVILLTICWAFAVLTLRMSGIIIKVLYGLFNCAQVSGNHSCYFALLTVHCKIVLSLSLWTWTTVCIIGCVLFRLLFPAQWRGAQVLQGAHFEANGRRGRGRIPVIRCGVRWGDARTNNEGKTLLTNVVTVLWYNCAVCVWDRCGMGVCGRCTVCVCVCVHDRLLCTGDRCIVCVWQVPADVDSNVPPAGVVRQRERSVPQPPRDAHADDNDGSDCEMMVTTV